MILLKSLVDSISNCSHSGDTHAGAPTVVTSGVVTVVVVASIVVADTVVASPRFVFPTESNRTCVVFPCNNKRL